MPNLGKGTECIKILLSQASKDMYEPLVPMFFPVLGAHISGAEFQYPDLTWKELCGMMANLVADSGCNKGQLSNIVEAICHLNKSFLDACRWLADEHNVIISDKNYKAAALRNGTGRCNSPQASPGTYRHLWSVMPPTPTWQTSFSAKPARRRITTAY